MEDIINNLLKSDYRICINFIRKNYNLLISKKDKFFLILKHIYKEINDVRIILIMKNLNLGINKLFIYEELAECLSEGGMFNFSLETINSFINNNNSLEKERALILRDIYNKNIKEGYNDKGIKYKEGIIKDKEDIKLWGLIFTINGDIYKIEEYDDIIINKEEENNNNKEENNNNNKEIIKKEIIKKEIKLINYKELENLLNNKKIKIKFNNKKKPIKIKKKKKEKPIIFPCKQIFKTGKFIKFENKKYEKIIKKEKIYLKSKKNILKFSKLTLKNYLFVSQNMDKFVNFSIINHNNQYFYVSKYRKSLKIKNEKNLIQNLKIFKNFLKIAKFLIKKRFLINNKLLKSLYISKSGRFILNYFEINSKNSFNIYKEIIEIIFKLSFICKIPNIFNFNIKETLIMRIEILNILKIYKQKIYEELILINLNQ